MKLEDQLVCQELSEKISKLGVKADSLWWWAKTSREEDYLTDSDHLSLYDEPYYPAYTVAELGEMLPYIIRTDKHDYILGCYKRKTDYLVSFGLLKEILADTEANARAKMLIWLIENNHIKVESL